MFWLERSCCYSLDRPLDLDLIIGSVAMTTITMNTPSWYLVRIPRLEARTVLLFQPSSRPFLQAQSPTCCFPPPRCFQSFQVGKLIKNFLALFWLQNSNPPLYLETTTSPPPAPPAPPSPPSPSPPRCRCGIEGGKRIVGGDKIEVGIAIHILTYAYIY